jgi:hypothetical protein
VLTAAASPGTGSIVSYIWQDGKQQIGVGASITVSMQAGLHRISCTVLNSAGLTGADALDIQVNSPSLPVVHFTMTQDGTGASGNDTGIFTVQIASGSTAGVTLKSQVTSTTSIANYSWTSDGVESGKALSVDSTFLLGSHAVKLTVVDSAGSTASASATLVVTAGGPKAAFNFSGIGGDQPGQENLTVNYKVAANAAVDISMWADRSQSASSYSWVVDGKAIGQARFESIAFGQGYSRPFSHR